MSHKTNTIFLRIKSTVMGGGGKDISSKFTPWNPKILTLGKKLFQKGFKH